MSKVLLKFQKDYADEFDVYGFEIIDKDKWEEIKQYVHSQEFIDDNGKWAYERYFGTNEGLIFDTPEEYISSFEEIEINDEDFNIFKKYQLTSFGFCPIEF